MREFSFKKKLLLKNNNEKTSPTPRPEPVLIIPSDKHRSHFCPNSNSDLLNLFDSDILTSEEKTNTHLSALYNYYFRGLNL
jgi:hypothetical protein